MRVQVALGLGTTEGIGSWPGGQTPGWPGCEGNEIQVHPGKGEAGHGEGSILPF